MSDGTDTIAETTTDETVGLPTEPITDPGLPAEPPVEEPIVPPEEFDEIEFDGEKYQVPKKLKDGFLMQSDYTRKTQEVAQQRKAIEAEREAIKKQEEAIKQQSEGQRAHLQDLGRVAALDEYIAALDKTDWSKLGTEDPFKADELFRQRMLLREQRDRLSAQIQANEQQRSQEAQQAFAKRYAETNEALASDIKGWNQELANKLVDFAKANGATDEDIRTLAVNAPLVKLLHKAYLGEQLIETKQTAARAAEPKIPIKPLTKVTGNGAQPSIGLADADMETYVSLRKKQGFGRR